MNRSSNQRARNLGLAGGSLWLISAGFVFAAWALLTVQSTVATAGLVGIAAVAGMPIFWGIGLIRKVRQEPLEGSPLLSERKKIMRQFAMIAAAELIAIAIVNIICVLALHHSRYIVPLDIVIVGLHYFPLARLFQVPRYNLMGVLFCAIPIATMLTTRHSARVGHGVIWVIVPGIGCGLVAMATGMAGLNEVRKSVNRFQQS